MKLRDYQQEAVIALNKATKDTVLHSRGFLSLPTGAGKTFTAAAWLDSCRDSYDYAIWACHREELKSQAIEALELFFDKDSISIWDARTKPTEFKKIVVVMIPSTRNFPYSYFFSIIKLPFLHFR